MLWLLSVRSTLKENAEDTLCWNEVCVYMSDRSYRAVDNCSVQRLTGKQNLCVWSHRKNSLSLLFSPVVFSENHPKLCPPPPPPGVGSGGGGFVCFFVGDTRGSSIIVSMSATDRKVQKQSLSWWCGKMNSHHKKKRKKEKQKHMRCRYNPPAEKWRRAAAKQRPWKRVLERCEIPWVRFVVLVRGEPTVSRPV